MKKTYRIKTNNQELLIRKQNESDATSRWIEFQKKREDLMFGRKAQILRRHYMNFSSLPDMRSFDILRVKRKRKVQQEDYYEK